MTMECTLVVLKPDAVQRRLVGRLIHRFEAKGLQLQALRMLDVDTELARRMYHEHEGKDFYEPLVAFITSAPVVAMVWAGRDAIRMVRDMMGPTFGPDAPPGTLRGDFGLSRRYNLVHGSDSTKAAQREIPLFFQPEDLCEYTTSDDEWIYADIDREGDS